jgi:hypothetical protein
MALMVAVADRAVAQTATPEYSTQARQIGNYETDASPEVQAQASSQPPVTQGARQRRPSSRRSSLLFAGNLLGGYDDNAGATLGTGLGSVPLTSTSGYSGFADAALQFTRGTAARRIGVLTSASLQMYPDYLDAPAPGGKVRMNGQTKLFADNNLRFDTQVQYQPLFTPGLIDELTDVPSVGEVDQLTPAAGFPSAALIERRSLATGNHVYLDREWSRLDKTVVSYSYVGQKIVEGDEGNNRYQRASAEYRRSVTRAATLLAFYQYTNGRQTDALDVSRPNRQNNITVGSEFTRPLSRSRRIWLKGTAGAAHVENVTTSNMPVEGWIPTANASTAIDLTRHWQVQADYFRGFSMLQGLTAEFYSTDRANLSVAGRLWSRAELVVGGSYMNGRIALGSPGRDTFDLYSADVALRVALTSMLAASARYLHYSQRYSNRAALPSGFPAKYDRDAFQVGLSWAVSLAGAQVRGR